MILRSDSIVEVRKSNIVKMYGRYDIRPQILYLTSNKEGAIEWWHFVHFGAPQSSASQIVQTAVLQTAACRSSFRPGVIIFWGPSILGTDPSVEA